MSIRYASIERRCTDGHPTLRLECPWNRLRDSHSGNVVFGGEETPTPTRADSRSGAVGVAKGEAAERRQ